MGTKYSWASGFMEDITAIMKESGFTNTTIETNEMRLKYIVYVRTGFFKWLLKRNKVKTLVNHITPRGVKISVIFQRLNKRRHNV